VSTEEDVVLVGVSVAVVVFVGRLVFVGVCVAVAIGVNVFVDAGILVGVLVPVGVFVEVIVRVFVDVGVDVGVAVEVGVEVIVAVRVLWVSMTNCGGVVPSREEKITPSVLSATSANVYVPLPVTREVTLYSTHVFVPMAPLLSTAPLNKAG
jgi:hypothetical protein